ncbi:hypothetical protein BDM02DRAFT_3111224 [Thelephora ganbajun]|uniref:Uncharacterized protein n=1 Tax=Thelephora ganbajun TaxID=370292 RepID=A0ACB6ZMX9_THEGA|nr:hypothetical protein BDM02DRAFT_3111224 [Thelephora ganbajun]
MFYLPFLSRKNQNESSTESQDRPASPLGSFEGTGKEVEVVVMQREVEDLRGQIERQGVDIARSRVEEEKLMRECKGKKRRIMELEDEIQEMHGLHQEDVQKWIQHVQATEERLKQTEELLAVRSAELSGAHTFLSTTDRLSEAEVLSIVHDLNENIYQVAVNLTEEWEKLESPLVTGATDVDPASRPCIPALVQLVRNRNSMGLTFLLQSHLCSQVVSITSRLGRSQDSAILGSIYQRLSASEGNQSRPDGGR